MDAVVVEAEADQQRIEPEQALERAGDGNGAAGPDENRLAVEDSLQTRERCLKLG